MDGAMPGEVGGGAVGAYHYGVMARAIAAVDEAGGAPLSLDELAAANGMSAAHFQRVFSRWAGVSPKRLQQYLTLGHAKGLLRDRMTTLDAAHEAGLSGPGRLHDLFVRWEAMTPGEWAEGGDTTVRHAMVDSPFGEALVMTTARGICGIAFIADAGHEAAMADLAARWPGARLVEDAGVVGPLAEAAFRGGPVPLAPIGAPFAIKVWEALMRIPSGQVTTYAEVARAAGNPRAVRAAASAVGRNPVSWLIPCHRAIRKTGGLGGYHWGLPVKRAMLALEAARRDAA
jgi:AraC family transcriptional regulator of adaptative response/methylated-DNA-[protein]-cysteine methyltransferase